MWRERETERETRHGPAGCGTAPQRSACANRRAGRQPREAATRSRCAWPPDVARDAARRCTHAAISPRGTGCRPGQVTVIKSWPDGVWCVQITDSDVYVAHHSSGGYISYRVHTHTPGGVCDGVYR